MLITFATLVGLTASQGYLPAQPVNHENANRSLEPLELELTTIQLVGGNLVSEYIQLTNPAAYQIRMEQEASTFDPKELPLMDVTGDVYRWSLPLNQADIRLAGGKKLTPNEYRSLYGQVRVPVIVTDEPARLTGEFASYLSSDALILARPSVQLLKIDSERDIFSSNEPAEIPIAIRVYLPVFDTVFTSTEHVSMLAPYLGSLSLQTVEGTYTYREYLGVSGPSEAYTYTIEVPVTEQIELAYTVPVPQTVEETYTVQVPYIEEVAVTYQEDDGEPITRTRAVTKYRSEQRVRERMETRIETRTRMVPVTRMIEETRQRFMPAPGKSTHIRISSKRAAETIALGHAIAAACDPLPSYGELFMPQIEWLPGEYSTELSSLLTYIANTDLKIDLSKIPEAFVFNEGLFLKSNSPNSRAWLRITYSNGRVRLEESMRDAAHIYLTIPGKKKHQLRLPIEGGTAEAKSTTWKPLVDVLRIERDALAMMSQLQIRSSTTTN